MRIVSMLLLISLLTGCGFSYNIYWHGTTAVDNTTFTPDKKKVNKY